MDYDDPLIEKAAAAAYEARRAYLVATVNAMPARFEDASPTTQFVTLGEVFDIMDDEAAEPETAADRVFRSTALATLKG